MTTNFKNQDFIKSLAPGIATINTLTTQRNLAIGGLFVMTGIAIYYIYQDVKTPQNVQLATDTNSNKALRKVA